MVNTEIKLNMHIFIDELSTYNPVASIDNSTELCLTQVRFLPTNSSELSDDILYISDSSNLKSINESEKKLNFICHNKDENAAQQTINTNLNIVFLDGSLSAQTLFNILLDIFEKYRRWNQRMLDCILNLGAMQELMDIGVEMLRNPIALFNNSLELIIYSGKLPEHYEGTIWEKVILTGYTPLEDYTDSQKKELFMELGDQREPFLYKSSESDKYTNLIANLYKNDLKIGSFGSTDINQPYSLGQQSLVGHLKKIVEAAFCIQMEEEFYVPDSNSIIERKLKGYYVEERVIEAFLSEQNWNNINSYYLIVFDCFIADFTEESMVKLYRSRIKRFLPKALIVLYKNQLVAVQPGDSEFYSIKDFKKFLSESGLKCGISLKFQEFIELKYNYKQALSALREGLNKPDSSTQHPNCFLYQDYFTEDLIHSLEKESGLRHLCRPEILILKEHDDHAGSEYIKTLYQYLLCGRNISATSEALFIHRNTLIYRIERIKEIIDVDLDESRYLFHTLFSCILAGFL